MGTVSNRRRESGRTILIGLLCFIVWMLSHGGLYGLLQSAGDNSDNTLYVFLYATIRTCIFYQWIICFSYAWKTRLALSTTLGAAYYASTPIAASFLLSEPAATLYSADNPIPVLLAAGAVLGIILALASFLVNSIQNKIRGQKATTAEVNTPSQNRNES